MNIGSDFSSFIRKIVIPSGYKILPQIVMVSGSIFLMVADYMARSTFAMDV